MRSVTVSRARVDARARSRSKPDLARQEPPELCVGQGGERADRLQARCSQPSLGARADPGQSAHVERREERGLAARGDDRQPAWLAAVARDLGDDLRGRDRSRR